MNWIESTIKPKKTGEDNEYIVWVYDVSMEIGYVWPSTVWYKNKKWYETGEVCNKELYQDKEFFVTYYCQLPRPKDKSRKPSGV